MIDSKLSWSKHINLLAAKISRNAGILYKLKGIVPNSTLKLLYNSFINSHLNYCSSVWGLGSKNSTAKLFIAQKKATRALDNNYNNYFYDKTTGAHPCHTKEIFNHNDILTINNLITKNCLILMHKIYLNVAPPAISNLFNIINLHQARRDPKYFEIPYNRLKSSDNSVTYKGSRLYNFIANQINKNLPKGEPLLQNKFTNPYKATVTRYLINIQKLGNETWSNENFVSIS